MTTYRGIKGLGIQSVTSDAIASQVLGGTWSSGGALNTARRELAPAGTQTANIEMGGDSPGKNEVESYDGSSWSELTEVNTARTRAGGAGTTTAALFYGGGTGPSDYNVSNETWNGSSWTEVSELNTGRQYISGAGTNTAAVGVGGQTPSASNTVESWNGASWTETTEINTARSVVGAAGVSTAIIITGGLEPSLSDKTELWDNSSWTESGDLNTARYGAGLSGTTTAGLAFGGAPLPKAVTENFNGSSWTELADLSTARGELGGSPAGSSVSALAAGGNTPPSTTATEEWTAPAVFRQFNVGDIYYNADPSSGAIKYVGYGTGAWASGGDMNVQGYAIFSLGTQTAAIRAGGYGGPPVGYQNDSESYNGTAWTQGNDINTARTNESGVGSGTTAAGLIYGGNTPPFSNAVESYNGTSWSETTEINTARYGCSGGGTQTATIAFAGQKSPGSGGYANEVELWNGTSWTETAEVNTARGGGAGVGQVSTAALLVGGYTGTATATNNEVWNGSSWTESSGDLNTGRNNAMARAGTSTDGFVAGGYQSSGPSTGYKANTELFNGTSWTELADLATARYGIGGQGATAKAAVAFGGNTAASDPAGVVTTEEWTVPEELQTLASTNA